MCISNFQVKKKYSFTQVYLRKTNIIFFYRVGIGYRNKIVLFKYKIQVKIAKMTVTNYVKLLNINLKEFKTE